MTKRVVILSDLHCGHRAGLTPPHRHDRAHGWNSAAGERFAKARAEMWGYFSSEIRKVRPIDLLICNGDAIDGKGDRTGGTEQLELDRNEQAKIAAEVLKFCKPKTILMTFGTPYHTGKLEDYERVTADIVGAEIAPKLDVDVNGLIFNVRHEISGSQVPHGRYTALARHRLWNLLWFEGGIDPKADVLIRSHVHYHVGCFGDGWLAMITPALQGLGSKYGSRKCIGTVDFGFVFFDVGKRGEYRWAKRVRRIEAQKSRVHTV